LDGNGDVDFVVGNMDNNWQWHQTAPQSLNLYADISSASTPIPIVSMLDGENEYPYASRDELTGQLPHLRKAFRTCEGYAIATLKDLFSAAVLHKTGKKKPQGLVAEFWKIPRRA
jgi:enediyne biosynthesis protein E4